MNLDMTLQDFMVMKSTLENKIRDAINEFERMAPVKVESIEFTRANEVGSYKGFVHHVDCDSKFTMR